MALTGVEIIAVIFCILGLVKLISISINKTWWFNSVSSKVYGRPRLWSWIFLVLAIIIFYLLIQEMTLAQVMSGVFFASLLIGIGLMAVSKDVLSIGKKVIKKKFNAQMRAYIIIWIVLIIWTLYEIFWG